MSFFDDELRKLQQIKAQNDALEQAQLAQQSYNDQMAQAQNALSIAQNKPTNPLESVLSGIGNSIANVGKTLVDIPGTTVANWMDLIQGKKQDAEGSNTQEWKKSLYGGENAKERYAKTAGTALDAAATVSDLIPGLGTAAKVGLNVGQGVASGIAQNYIDNGANVSLEDNLKSALVGGASAGVGQAVGGKLAKSTAMPKVLNNSIGKAAITGAASGATGGALASSLNGGDFGQNLSAALQGAGGGALGGATMAGAMGLAGAGIDKLNNKITGGANITPGTDTTVEAVKKVNLDPVKEAELERKYTVAKQKQGQALMAQYGTIDAPTARSVGDASQVLTNLYDDYGLKTPAEVQYAAKKLTGAEGTVSKMTRKLAASAGDIPSTYNVADLDQLIIDSGLGLDSTRGKALKQQVSSIVNSVKNSGDGIANANDVLDMVKKLERKSADVAGKSGNNYHRATSEDLAAASVLNAVASDYKDRIWNGAQDISTVLTPDAIKELKAIFPNNKTYQNGVDNIIAKATNGQELRHTMADLVNGSKIANNSKMIAGTTGAQLVKAATSANPAVAATQMLTIKALDSDAANKLRADKYAKRATKYQAKLTGETPAGNSFASNLANRVKNNVTDLAGALTNDTLTNASYAGVLPTFGEAMTSQLSRQAGLGAANAQENQAELQNAQQQVQNVQNDYNNAMTQAQTAYNNAQAMAVPETNANTARLEQITRAMDLALAAGDLDSYSQLASLYQTAYKIYAPAETATGGASSLNATQQNNLAKLESAGSAIDQLEQLYNQAGGGQGRLGGKLAELGANLGMNSAASSYNSAARGLINQIAAAVGKTDSLNTEGEVQRALDLVPKITDTPEEAQVKLQSLRNMLNANKQTYQNIYGVSQ